MKLAVATMILSLVALPVAPVLAKTIKKHETHQQQRINKGEANGKLTPTESTRLQNQQNTIEHERQQAAADGKITNRERQDIRHDQKRLNADIKHKKHNAKHD